MKKVAVLGYGNIGSGVVKVLLDNKEVIRRQAGEEIVPVKVLDLRSFPGDIMEDKVVNDIRLISEDPSIDIVVETMGGTRPAYEFVKICLEAGKHVATSNKELVAAHGAELLALAKEKKVNFLFEASVGGVIPIIRALNSCITSDEVTEITGILNGTTNYMLTGMAEKGCSYEEMLKKAQELGFAERNPAADVEGFDACRKIAILSSVVFGKEADYKEILTEGITAVSKEDMAYAGKLGKTIRLFGSCRKTEEGLCALVSPVMIGPDHPLFSVKGVMNAVLVRGKMMGDLMFYGAGAGKLPTASAVAADVVSAVRHPDGGEMTGYSSEKLSLADAGKEKRNWFVRLSGKPDEEIRKAFGAEKTETIDGYLEFALISSPMSLAEMNALAEKYPVISRIRMAD